MDDGIKVDCVEEVVGEGCCVTSVRGTFIALFSIAGVEKSVAGALNAHPVITRQTPINRLMDRNEFIFLSGLVIFLTYF